MPSALPDAVMDEIHNRLFVVENDIASIAMEFNVSERAVRKWKQNWQLFGRPRDPKKTEEPKKARTKTFTDEEELALLSHLKEKPDTSIEDMAKFLSEKYNKKAAANTIWEILHRHGWSRTEAENYLTPHRTIFFWEWDKPNGIKPLRSFVQAHKDEEWCPAQAQAYRWIQQRTEALKQGRQSPTRAPGPQKPVGRPKKDMNALMDDEINGPRALGKAARKRLLAEAGISPATYYRRLRERNQQNPQSPSQEGSPQATPSSGKQNAPNAPVTPTPLPPPMAPMAPLAPAANPYYTSSAAVSAELLDNIEVRDATPNDAPAIAEIYTHYVNTSIATLAEQAPSLAQTAAQIQQTSSSSIDLPYVVATVTATGPVCGYAYAAPWSDRGGYRPAAADSVYVHPDAQGRGVGRKLLEALLQRLVLGSTKTQLLAAMSISPGQAVETIASGRLHLNMGFKCVGRMERVGLKFGEVVDVVTFQLDLESLRQAQQQA